ncbi:MAG TPA: hypothetical protein VJN18_18105 [Polyangiaceae bacterium]|nr:hypothetical protein [Polyangiaceae bacterium]
MKSTTPRRDCWMSDVVHCPACPMGPELRVLDPHLPTYAGSVAWSGSTAAS